MSLDYVKPSPALLAELEDVAANAASLADYLAAPNIPLVGFPTERLRHICASLNRLPEGTAEGCRAPLAYARIELPRIRRAHVLRPSEAKPDADAPPAISREDRLDLLLKELIASVSTAIAEYQTESTSEIPEGLEPEPPVDATRSDAAEEALRQSEELDAAVKASRPPVEALKNAGVALAETLDRQLTDIATNTSAARAELRSEEARPSLLEMLAAANRALPEVLDRTGIAIEKLAETAEIARDVSKPVRDWMRKVRQDGLSLVIASAKEFGKALRETATVWKAKVGSKPAKPPADFDIDKVKEMILAGVAPPLTWRPWIDKLDFTGEKLTDLAPLKGLTALRTLDLWGTQVSDIAPLAGLTALETLDLRRTQVSDIAPLAGLTALETLDLGTTQVSDIAPLAGLTALRTLGLWATQVSDLAPLAGLTALRTLELRRTQVSDIAPLAGLTALETLHLQGTQVSDIAPLAGLTALETLDLRRTQVSDIAPLAGLTALQSLDLWGTQVSDIAPLAGLTALETLYLQGTRVSDIARLAGLNIETIWVENEERRAALARTLGARGDIVKVRE